ncbi:hypothetical protein JCM8547_002111 [Rhodosporidiobolus lusitaniae]
MLAWLLKLVVLFLNIRSSHAALRPSGSHRGEKEGAAVGRTGGGGGGTARARDKRLKEEAMNWIVWPAMPPPARLGPRIRAIATPCPSCIPVSPRIASIVSCGILTVIYLAWSILLWKGYFLASKAKTTATSTTLGELNLMSRYMAFTAFFSCTMTLVALGAFIVGAFPQRDFAKHFSRTLWVGWLVTWTLGIFGIVTYLSTDAFLVAGCVKGNECWSFRQRLQIWIVIALFVTLILAFWFNVILSAFVHTLHPHIFLSPDSDSEDDYSDYEAEREAAIDVELRDSEHPWATEALAARALKRIQERGRSVSRQRRGYADDGEEEDPASEMWSTEKGIRRGRGGSTSSLAQYSDEDAFSSAGSEDEPEKVLMPSSSSSRRGRSATSRRVGALSSIESVEEDSASPPPPSYRSRSGRGRSGSSAGAGLVDEEQELGRSRSRTRSRSRSRARV